MIEQAIKTALERITGLLAYPLLLPKRDLYRGDAPYRYRAQVYAGHGRG